MFYHHCPERIAELLVSYLIICNISYKTENIRTGSLKYQPHNFDAPSD